MPEFYRKNGLLAVLVLACTLTGGAGHATVHQIDIGNFFFAPVKTTVSPGDTVRWTLVGGTHTTTSEVTSPKAWDSGIIAVSGSFDVVFTAGDGPGPFPYLCSVHPFTMKDTIFMAAAPSEPTVFTFLVAEAPANACIGTGSSAAGFGQAVLNGDSTELSFTIEHTVSGVTDAHIHLAPPCSNGGVAFGFASPVSPIVETWSVTPTDVTNLLAGNLYINIHSSAFPAGEIRGQVDGPPWFCGDINGGGTPQVDISDLVYLVDYMFTGGPAPIYPDSGDLNGSGGLDISDLVYLVDYMFTGGPLPTC